MANQTITIRLSALTQKFRKDMDRATDSVEDLDRATKKVDGSKFRRETDKNEKSASELSDTIKRLVKNFIKFKVIMGAIKFGAIYTGIRLLLPLLSAASAALFAMASSLGIFGGAIVAYPAAMAGVLSAFGALKFATMGVSESLGVLLSDEASLEDYTKAMDNSSTAVQNFAKELNGLRKETEQSQGRAQDALFGGLVTALQTLRSSGVVPLVTRHFEKMAGVLGDLAAGFAKMVGKDSVLSDLKVIMDGNETAVRTFGRVLTNLAEALLVVLAAATPVIRDVLDTMRRKSEGLAQTLDRASLTEYFERVVDAFKRLGSNVATAYRGLKNVSDILTESRLRDRFLDPLEQGLKTFEAFTSSDMGKTSIVSWFERGADVMDAFYRVLGAITTGLRSMDGGSTALIRFFDLIAAEGGLITQFFKAMGAFDLNKLVDMFIALGEAFIAIFEASAMLESLVVIVTAFAKAIEWVANLFSYLPDDVRKVVGTMSALALLFPFMRGPIRKVVWWLMRMGGAQVLAGLKGVWHGLSALSSGLFGTSTNAAHATGRMSRFGQAIRNGMSRGVTAVGNFARAIGPWLRNFIFKAMVNVRLLFDLLKGGFARGLARVVAFGSRMSMVFTSIRLVVTMVFSAIKMVVVQTLAAIGRAILASMATNPVGWIILAIVALIAVFVLLWKKSETFRNFILGAWAAILSGAKAAWNWVKNNWTHLLSVLGPFGTMLGVFIRNFDAIKDKATRAMETVKQAFRDAVAFVRGLPGVDMVMNFIGVDGVTKASNKGQTKNKYGDVSAQRGSSGGGNLRSTMGLHAAVEKATPGKRSISNATKGRWAGSDHHKGRALDLVGPFMGAYKRNLEAMGGMAETHGQGSGTHLHAVYPASGFSAGGGSPVVAGGPSGDTMRARSPKGGGGGTSVVVEGPLIGQVIADSEVDVTRAVQRALSEFTEEWIERR